MRKSIIKNQLVAILVAIILLFSINALFALVNSEEASIEFKAGNQVPPIPNESGAFYFDGTATVSGSNLVIATGNSFKYVISAPTTGNYLIYFKFQNRAQSGNSSFAVVSQTSTRNLFSDGQWHYVTRVANKRNDTTYATPYGSINLEKGLNTVEFLHDSVPITLQSIKLVLNTEFSVKDDGTLSDVFVSAHNYNDSVDNTIAGSANYQKNAYYHYVKWLANKGLPSSSLPSGALSAAGYTYYLAPPYSLQNWIDETGVDIFSYSFMGGSAIENASLGASTYNRIYRAELTNAYSVIIRENSFFVKYSFLVQENGNYEIYSSTTGNKINGGFNLHEEVTGTELSSSPLHIYNLSTNSFSETKFNGQIYLEAGVVYTVRLTLNNETSMLRYLRLKKLDNPNELVFSASSMTKDIRTTRIGETNDILKFASQSAATKRVNIINSGIYKISIKARNAEKATASLLVSDVTEADYFEGTQINGARRNTVAGNVPSVYEEGDNEASKASKEAGTGQEIYMDLGYIYLQTGERKLQFVATAPFALASTRLDFMSSSNPDGDSYVVLAKDYMEGGSMLGFYSVDSTTPEFLHGSTMKITNGGWAKYRAYLPSGRYKVVANFNGESPNYESLFIEHLGSSVRGGGLVKIRSTGSVEPLNILAEGEAHGFLNLEEGENTLKIFSDSTVAYNYIKLIRIGDCVYPNIKLYKDSAEQDNEISAVSPGNLIVQVDFPVNWHNMESLLIVAVYREGLLWDVLTEKVLKVGDATVFQKTFTVEDNGLEHSIEVFLWDDRQNARPYVFCKSYEGSR